MADIMPRDPLPGRMAADPHAVVIELDDAPAPHARSGSPGDPDVVTVSEDGAAADGLPGHAIRHPDGSVELPLHWPVALKFKRPSQPEAREERFDRITFHRLTGAHMREITGADKRDAMPLTLALSARMPRAKMDAVFDRMDASDALACITVVSAFLGTGPATGR